MAKDKDSEAKIESDKAALAEAKSQLAVVQAELERVTALEDYNLTNNHRASFAYNYQKFNSFPDTLNNREVSFPGFPVEAGQSSKRSTSSSFGCGVNPSGRSRS